MHFHLTILGFLLCLLVKVHFSFASGEVIDEYEEDDSASQANVIILGETAQIHTLFLDFEDWVKFYALEGNFYDFITDISVGGCGLALRVHDQAGNVLPGESLGVNILSWECPENGIYTLRVWPNGDPNECQQFYYIYILSAQKQGPQFPGVIQGQVYDMDTLLGIEDARITAIPTGAGNAIWGGFSALSQSDGSYKIYAEEGQYDFFVEAKGYRTSNTLSVVADPDNVSTVDLELAPSEPLLELTICNDTTLKIDFGTVAFPILKPNTCDIVLHNAGDADLEKIQFTLLDTTNYAVSWDLDGLSPTMIVPGSSRTATLTYNPLGSGEHNTNIKIEWPGKGITNRSEINILGRAENPDEFEPDGGDNSPQTATVLILNDTPQLHNFHRTDDEDWVVFHALEGFTYHVDANSLTPSIDIRLEIFDNEGLEPPGGQPAIGLNSLEWISPNDGIYTVQARLAQTSSVTSENKPNAAKIPNEALVQADTLLEDIEYRLSIRTDDIFQSPGYLRGHVSDAQNTASITRAKITARLPSGNGSTGTYTGLSDDSGSYTIVVEEGYYTVTAAADYYSPNTVTEFPVIDEQELGFQLNRTPEFCLAEPFLIRIGIGYEKSLTYTEIDRTNVSIRLRGPGSAEITICGDTIQPTKKGVEVIGNDAWIDEIRLVDTTWKSSLIIKAKGGDNIARIKSITGFTPLKRLDGRNIDLVGMGILMTHDGIIGNIRLNDVWNSADIVMDGKGTKNGVILIADTLHAGCDIILQDGLRMLTLKSWKNGSLLSAPWARVINVKESCGANMNFFDQQSNGSSLHSLIVKKQFTANNISMIGSVNRVKIGGWNKEIAGGCLSARSLNSLLLKGDLNNIDMIFIGQQDGSDHSIKTVKIMGTVSDSVIATVNSVRSFIVNKWDVNSHLMVGTLDPNVSSDCIVLKEMPIGSGNNSHIGHLNIRSYDPNTATIHYGVISPNINKFILEGRLVPSDYQDGYFRVAQEH